MTLGEKIRKYRSLKNMTQKELGLAIGFSGATADSRIRKYERDVMAPKQDIRAKLAEVLDVDISALSENDIHNEEDIMQTLFIFEELYGMEIDRDEDKTTLTFDNHDKDLAKLTSYLYTWYRQKKSLVESENLDEKAAHDALERYDQWKARFPKDNYEFWDEQKNKVAGIYEPEVTKLLGSEKPIETISQFIQQLRRLIRYHVMIESYAKMLTPKDGGLTLRFLTAELLDPDTSEVKKELTYFFYTLKCLESYGLPIYINLLTNEQGTKICYTLHLSSLMSISSIIVKIQEYENNREKMTDWESSMFEMQYEEYLKDYNINFKEEIERKSKRK